VLIKEDYFMSRITFLDNASQGENSWKKYILTTALTWGGSIIFLSLVLGLYSSLTGSNLVFIIPNSNIISNLIDCAGYAIAFVFFYLCIHFIHKRKFISLVNTGSGVSWRRILKGFGVWFIVQAIGTLIFFVVDPTAFEVTFNWSSFLLILCLSLILFPIEASTEELFFRGYLMQGIGLLSKKPIVPLITTSLIFTIIHWWHCADVFSAMYVMSNIFIVSIILGITVLGENRLETAIGAHIANNTFVALIFTGQIGGLGNMPAILTFSSCGTSDILIDSVISVLSALAFIMIIFWNKKEKIQQIFKEK
jgi:uncharacterized protein